MTTLPMLALTGAAALGCATAGGVFFAFSSFVMPGLARLTPASGVAAMQAINVTAVRPPFMAVLFGSAVASIVGTAVALGTDAPSRTPFVVGTLVYLVGVIGTTVVVHVPLNNRLTTVSATSTDLSSQWSHYLGRWSRWNHLRAVAGVAAAASIALGLRS